MAICLRVLIVEHQAADAELMVHELRRAGFEPEWARVDAETDYVAAIKSSPDVILSDHTLPRFTALQALELLKRRGLSIPLIVVTKSIGEEAAVECLKQGAADYILKGRLVRLGPAVKRALEEKKLSDERQRAAAALRESELHFRELADIIDEILFIAGPDGSPIYYVNPAHERITGQSPEILYQNPRAWMETVHPEDRLRVLEAYSNHPESLDQEYRIIRVDGGVRWLRVQAFAIKDEHGRVVRAVGISADITKRKQAEEKARQNFDRIQALREIDRAISSTLDLRAVLNILMEKIDLVLPYSATAIRLFNPTSGLLEPAACRNLDEEDWRLEQWKAGRGPANEVFETKTPLMIHNCYTDPRVKDPGFFRKHALVSYLGVPMFAKEEILGVLSFYTKEEHEYTAEEVEFLSALAGQAVIAIHNAQLYEEARSREAQLEETNRMLSALHAVAAAASQSPDLDPVLQTAIEKITEVFRFDATRIHVYDEQTDELRLRASFESDPDRFTVARSFPRGQGIVGRVAESGKRLIFEDVETDPLYRQFSRTKVSSQYGYHFFGVFPINGKLKNLGTLGCVGATPRKLTSSEIQLLEAITERMGVAIENFGLYEQLTQKVDELQQRTMELERANKVKDEFLSVMSHELRTPLNVVVGYTGMMLDGLMGKINPQQQEALGKVIARANDELAIVNNILFATVMETEKINVESQVMVLGDFLKQLKSVYDIPLHKEVVMNWECSSPLSVIHTDGAKLKHILQNLIDNAIKFTPRGSITISAGTGQESVVFKVADTGAGIPQEHLSTIFEKFRQVDSSETRLFGGVGMGLYIVKKFTELLGGTVQVESEPDKGSTFTVNIPMQF